MAIPSTYLGVASRFHHGYRGTDESTPSRRCKEIGRKRGARPGKLAKVGDPADLASDQPFFTVERAGTVCSTATIFILSPPPIYLRDEAVSGLYTRRGGVSRGWTPRGLLLVTSW